MIKQLLSNNWNS